MLLYRGVVDDTRLAMIIERFKTADHILFAHLWTSTVVGHDVWSNRGSAARDMRRAPGSA